MDSTALRSRRDLRPLTEPGGPVYVRRAGDVLEVRRARAVRRVPLGEVAELVTYDYEYRPQRGASYHRYGLLVCGAGRRPLAHLGSAVEPAWDDGEVAAFAERWGVRASHRHLRDQQAFATAYGKLGAVEVRSGGTVGALAFVLGLLVAALGGAFLGIVLLELLGGALGIAHRPGVPVVLAIGGIGLGGTGCLLLLFAAADLLRHGTAGLRARLARDGALRPTPRHGPLRLSVEDDELVCHTPDAHRLVLPWTPAAQADRSPVAVLQRFQAVGDAGVRGGLLVVDARGAAVVLVGCPFAAGEVAEFAGRWGLAAPEPVSFSASELEVRLARVPASARVTPEVRAGFFTWAVGVTVLGVLAYLPVVVCVVLLVGLLLPASLTTIIAILVAVVPLPFLGPLAARRLTRSH